MKRHSLLVFDALAAAICLTAGFAVAQQTPKRSVTKIAGDL